MSNRVYIRTDKNGTKIYHDYTCPRCGGAGGSDKWAFTGWTCYECGGTGERHDKPEIIKVYTPEYRAKLDERNRIRWEKQRAKKAEEFKANLSDHIQQKGFNADGKLYVAVGDTFSIKDQLREAGAKWKPHLNSWVFTEAPTEFATVELTAEECLVFHYEDGWCDWSHEVNFKELIQSKLPKEDVVVSEYVGAIGDKLDAQVTFIKYFSYERNAYRGWGTELVRIYKFLDANGNILIWNTTAWLEVEEGKQYQLTGSIAEHKEYAGDKQTILKRCKIKEVA